MSYSTEEVTYYYLSVVHVGYMIYHASTVLCMVHLYLIVQDISLPTMAAVLPRVPDDNELRKLFPEEILEQPQPLVRAITRNILPRPD